MVLIGTGMVMIYNSTAITAADTYGDSNYFVKLQFMWLGVGIVGFLVAAIFDYRVLVKNGPLFLLLSVALLAMVFSPIGIEKNGAHRWIRILGRDVQPSEPAKYGVLLFLVYMLSRKQRKVHKLMSGYLPMLLGLCVVLGLVFVQPDLSSTILIGSTAFVLFFIGGVKVVHLLGTVAPAIPLVAVLMYKSGYQMMRILAWLDPWKYVKSAGLQPIESMTALGVGGIRGVGIGMSRQKLWFLPYCHNDFIGAIIGEETGFVGMAILLLLFVGLAVAGGMIAFKMRDLSGYLLASGITVLITLQAMIHMAVITGSIPATGINLPFVSFGGSNLVMNCIGIGMLVNVSRRSELQPKRKFAVGGSG
jgi:cell division protein FtsW